MYRKGQALRVGRLSGLGIAPVVATAANTAIDAALNSLVGNLFGQSEEFLERDALRHLMYGYMRAFRNLMEALPPSDFTDEIYDYWTGTILPLNDNPPSTKDGLTAAVEKVSAGIFVIKQGIYDNGFDVDASMVIRTTGLENLDADLIDFGPLLAYQPVADGASEVGTSSLLSGIGSSPGLILGLALAGLVFSKIKR